MYTLRKLQYLDSREQSDKCHQNLHDMTTLSTMEETPLQTGAIFLMHAKIIRKGFLSWDTFQVFEDTTLKHSGHTSLSSESMVLRDSSAPPPCQVKADPEGEVPRSAVKGADELPPGVWSESPQRPQGAFRHSLSVTLHSYLGIHSW